MSSHFQDTVSLFGRLFQLSNELYIIAVSAVPLGDKIWIEYKICCREEKIRWRISSRAGKEERWLKFMKHKVEHLPFFFSSSWFSGSASFRQFVLCSHCDIRLVQGCWLCSSVTGQGLCVPGLIYPVTCLFLQLLFFKVHICYFTSKEFHCISKFLTLNSRCLWNFSAPFSYFCIFAISLK